MQYENISTVSDCVQRQKVDLTRERWARLKDHSLLSQNIDAISITGPQSTGTLIIKN